MITGIRVEQILLWVFVILAALVLGGGLYELRVVIPLWAHAPPESVWTFAQLRNSQPAFTPNAGIRFWIFLTPVHLLISIATFVACLKTRGAHRRWVMISTAAFIVLHLAALFYFVPALDKIFSSQNSGMAPAEVVSRVHTWVYGTWIRFVISLAGFVCGLKAMKVKPVASDQ
jgi:lysylphosphatidylglycerol synthetase-like protein (DUF2156 family)